MLELQLPEIVGPSAEHAKLAQQKIRQHIKPRYALGRLTELAVQLAGATGKLDSDSRARLIVFCGDHGVSAEGVSVMLPSDTRHLVEAFATETGAINAICHAVGADLEVVDVGTTTVPSSSRRIVSRRVRAGTSDIRYAPAMSMQDACAAILIGVERAAVAASDEFSIIGVGETGIGNTTSSSALLSVLTGWPPAITVGRGTGVTGSVFVRKKLIVEEAIRRANQSAPTPLSQLAELGGIEIAAMIGAMIGGAAHRMLVVVDGFAASVAALIALRLRPGLAPFLVFAHKSREKCHRRLLRFLGVRPLLDLRMGLGEGSGAALAFPLIAAAAGLLHELNCYPESVPLPTRRLARSVRP